MSHARRVGSLLIYFTLTVILGCGSPRGSAAEATSDPPPELQDELSGTVAFDGQSGDVYFKFELEHDGFGFDRELNVSPEATIVDGRHAIGTDWIPRWQVNSIVITRDDERIEVPADLCRDLFNPSLRVWYDAGGSTHPTMDYTWWVRG